MRAGLRVDELDIDAQPIAGALNAALQHITHVQLAPDLLQIDMFSLVGESSVAPDHERAGDAREIGGQALRHAIDEILLLWIAADVGEGQNHDGEAWWTRLVRCGGVRRGRWACRAGLDRIDSHWPSDVLEFFLSEIDEAFLEAVTHLAVGVLGKTDTARISNTFEARGDIDAVAHQVAVALLDHIAQMDADAELDAALGRKPGVALDHAVLHLDGAAYGIDHASELDEDAVTGALHHAPVMHGDGRDRSDRSAAPAAAPVSAPRRRQQACCIRPHPPQEWLRVSGSPPWQSLHHKPE